MTTRLHGNPRACPVPIRYTRRGAPVICAATVRPGDLMCMDHWDLLPGPVKAAVRRTWDTWEADGFGDPEAHAAYLAARADALDRATEVVIPKR